MIRPAALKEGDCVGLVSTARKISQAELAPAIERLENWGYKVRTAPNLFREFHQLAGTDKERASDLQFLIDDPEVKAILCVRGGYGTVRVIDDIDFGPLLSNPKWVAGYSDVTVLHNKLTKLGIESLHSSMPINFATNTDAALNSLRDALAGSSVQYNIEPHPFNQTGHAKGLVTGGNLSMLYSQTGSDTALSTEGAILFMEDLDEYLYHIDRMMWNLKRNRYFEKPAAVLVGGMSDMNDNTVPFGQTAEEIIHTHLKEAAYPVCFGFPAGHLSDNRTLIFGRMASLQVAEDKVQLSFDG